MPRPRRFIPRPGLAVATLVASALLAAAVAGPARAGECVRQTVYKPRKLSHYRSFRAYYNAKHGAAEAAKQGVVDEASAQQALCQGPCSPWTPAYGDAIMMDVLVPDDRGGVHVLAEMGESGSCISKGAEATALGDQLFLVTVQQIGRPCEDFDVEDADWTFLLDLRSRRFLVAINHQASGDRVTLAGDRIAVTACGRPETYSVKALRAQAGWTPPPAPDAALPTGPKALLAEGRKRTRAGHHVAAVRAYEAALALQPASAGITAELGYALYLGGWLAKARATLERALTLDADADAKRQGIVWYNLGLVAEGAGDEAAAKVAFTKAHALKPSKATRAKLGLPK